MTIYTYSCNNVVINTDGSVFPCFYRREYLGSINEEFKSISANKLKFLDENSKKLIAQLLLIFHYYD